VAYGRATLDAGRHPALGLALAVTLWTCAVAAADVALPMPSQSAPVGIRAGQANWWRQDNYEVWLLREGCEITQGDLHARGREAVLWVDRAEPLSGHVSKMLAYVEGGEGDVSIESTHTGPAHPQTGRSANLLRASQWFGRFHTTSRIDIDAPVTGFAPKVIPAVYERAVQAQGADGSEPVRQAQFSTTVPAYIPDVPPAAPVWTAPGAIPWTPTTPPPGTAPPGAPPLPPPALTPATPSRPRPTARSIIVRSRSTVPAQAKEFLSPDGRETIVVISSGVNVVVEGIQNVQGLTDGKIDIDSDRIVIWTARLDALALNGRPTGEKVPLKDAPLEFYMEGNIVFREGDRVIYAERMYYNVQRRYGIVLNAEVLTPAPGYQGLVRLKANVLQQLDEHNFQAFGGAITSSRIGVPRYWLQAEQVTFQDVQTQRPDPFTGQVALDPVTGEPAVGHQYLATSRNNFLFAGGVPVLYWPVMATDLTKPNYYLDELRLKNDGVFGTQVQADWDLYQLLSFNDPPDGSEWGLSTDYLSDRGFALGTDFHYDRFGFLSVPGPVHGLFDAWGIKDTGLDNLGRDRRALTPNTEERGRILWQHRQYLSNGFQFTGEVGLISDRNFLEQYYEQEWDEQKDQITGLELKRLDANSSWGVSADVRLNDFFTQTESLPRFDHFLLGQDVFEYLTWYAHSHAGYAKLRTADLPPPPTEPTQVPLPWELDSSDLPYDEREGMLAATRHEIDLPIPLGPVKLVPYALGELAFWNEDVDGAEVNRAYGQAGIRGSLPFWSVNPEFRSLLFNVNGLAHKVILDADFFWADADENVDRFPLYEPLDDDATEHFQRRFLADLYPAGVPPGYDLPRRYDARFYALRSGMQSWVTAPSTEIADDLMVAKVGIRQRWQTKRGVPGQERIVDWITFDVEGAFFPEKDRDNFGEALGLFNYDFRWHVGDRFTVLSDGFADFFRDGLRTVAIGGLLTRPQRGNVYLGFRSIEGPFSSNLINAAVNYRMSEKWIVNAGGSIDLGSTGNIGESVSVTRIGESVLLRIGMHVDHSRDNVGVAFAIEPRFQSGRLSNVGGVPIPPVGAYGLE
jgi:hypothetical protein